MDSFPGTERFEISARLGVGGMGVVYRAFDRERELDVALKTLARVTADGIYRLKREFRALADITHPNLIVLHELCFAGGQWFFTMDLLDGTDFLSHTRTTRAPALASTKQLAQQAQSTASDLGAWAAAAGPAPGEPDEARLRAALAQVAQAVEAIHGAGKLHGDLKPGNVMVTRAGRVVVLDFGLAIALGEPPAREDHISGTPAYIAPERTLPGAETSEASDWYSVGVMLYEALTGWLPFSGSAGPVMERKRHEDPLPPDQLAQGLPGDLTLLCMDLLRRVPEQRPTGADVLRRLGCAASAPPMISIAAAAEAPAFVDREANLQALGEAFDSVMSGRPVRVHVRGTAGMGKTTLVQRFLNDLAARSDALVLTGRCYERESVPYKAFDVLVDALSDHLQQLAPEQVAQLLPRDIRVLARVFPALLRVDAIAEAPRRELETDDPHELRRRAFSAFKELLGRITDRRPLVVFIDDLQWGDVDSARLLSELLGPPDPPRMLLLVCYRSEEQRDNAALQAALRSDDAQAASVEMLELDVTPLPAAHARELATELLRGHAADAPVLADDIVAEGAGSPFLIWELVQYFRAGLSERGVQLEEMLATRIAQLPVGAQRLLQIIAVASHPLPQGLAARAAALDAEAEASLSYLRAAHLARSRGALPGDPIEPFHDVIRETVAKRLSPTARQERHRSLALALELAADPDPEALAVHWEGADEPLRAAEYAQQAALRAAEALAFDRAAELYRRALELKPEDDRAHRRELLTRLGEALTNAGRGHQAAQAFLSAAEGATAAEEIELKRRAAEQLLISGHVDEGHAVARWVLEALGLKFPPSPRRALLSLLAQRAKLSLRGLGYRAREERQIPAAELTRIDACWSLAVGLSLTDLVRGADFSTRYLTLSLASGEPRRIARALAAGAGHLYATGSHRRADSLMQQARRLARQTGDPRALALCHVVTEIGSFVQGRWQASLDAYEKAEVILREQCTGVAWEISTAHAYAAFSLFMMGQLRELSLRVPGMIREAQARDDFYAVHMLRAGTPITVWLMRDDLEGARRELHDASDRLSAKSFHFQHHTLVLGQVMTDLYAGDGRAALDRLAGSWSAHRRSLIFHTDYIHCLMLQLRAQAALAAGSEPALLRAAERDAARVMRFDIVSARPLAISIQATLAAKRGDRSRAVELFAAAVREFERGEMALLAAVMRRRQGALVGGDAGAALIAAGDRFMTEQRIKNPHAMTALLAPGFEDGTRSGGRGPLR